MVAYSLESICLAIWLASDDISGRGAGEGTRLAAATAQTFFSRRFASSHTTSSGFEPMIETGSGLLPNGGNQGRLRRANAFFSSGKDEQMNQAFTETPVAENVLVQETGAGRYQTRAEAGGAAFLIDEPVAFGGLGSGPNPYDLLSAALGACTAMTVRLYADRKDWPLDHVAVRVGHQRARSGAREQFDRELMIECPLDSVQRNRLLEITNRCPVHLALERGADIATSLRGPVLDERATRNHGAHVHNMSEACCEVVAPAA